MASTQDLRSGGAILKASAIKRCTFGFRLWVIQQIPFHGWHGALRLSEWRGRVPSLMGSGDRRGAAACLRAAKEPIGLRGCPDHTTGSAWGKESPRRYRSVPSTHIRNTNPEAVRTTPARRIAFVSKCWGVSALAQSTYVEFVTQAANSGDAVRDETDRSDKAKSKPDIQHSTQKRS